MLPPSLHEVASARETGRQRNFYFLKLKETQMKREQKFITMLSLILALSGLSPVAAADVGMEADGPQNQQTHQSNAPL
jgi:hypothetical protein